MKLQVRYRNLSDKRSLERELRRQTSKLARAVKKFDPDLVDLRINVERRAQPVRPFQVSATLYLPPGQLHVSESGADAVVALKHALAQLWRKLKKLKANLRREPDMRRLGRRRGRPVVA